MNITKKRGPNTHIKIKGVFYKIEETKWKSIYHFILPNIYHNDPNQNHTLNSLTDFDKKVENHFCSDQKLNNILLSSGNTVVKNYRPIYREKQLIHGDSDIQFTTFKCICKESFNFIVGLEYLLDVDCFSEQYQKDETVISWMIAINDVREVTKA